MKMNKNGSIVISLDFELLWGVFDVVSHDEKRKYFKNTRKVIPEILDLFSEYKVHATWAVVGMLFNRDWEEWRNNFPSSLPNYQKSELSAYLFGEQVSPDIPEESVFAPEIIKEINKVAGQEIATHTYSHYYCLEKGQDPSDFKADLQKSIELSRTAGIEIESLVFPRNQLKQEYLAICDQLGIKNVRSNPSSWYWKDTLSEGLYTKAARSGDAYLPFGKKSYKLEKTLREFPIEQKASRFLRPVEGNKILRELKLKRIEQEIGMAAKEKELYHLWWHPHNFGDKPEESLKDLRRILRKFERYRLSHGFQSLNMREVGELISDQN